MCVYSGSGLLADRKTASLRLKAQQLYNRVFHGPGVGPLKLCRAKPNPDDMGFSTTSFIAGDVCAELCRCGPDRYQSCDGPPPPSCVCAGDRLHSCAVPFVLLHISPSFFSYCLLITFSHIGSLFGHC